MRKSPRLELLGAARLAIANVANPNAYAVEAVDSMTEPGRESRSGMCMASAREDTQSVAGNIFNKYFYHGSARGSYNLLKKSPYVVKTSLPGDLRFYMNPIKHGVFGHVTRHIYGNLEKEVSSRYGKTGDCRGIQPLGFLGTPTLIIRFPLPKGVK